MVINTKIQIWDPRTQPTYNCGLYQVLSHSITGCCHGAMLHFTLLGCNAAYVGS